MLLPASHCVFGNVHLIYGYCRPGVSGNADTVDSAFGFSDVIDQGPEPARIG
jgi:hypothetical protein